MQFPASLDERVAHLEAEVARLSLFITLFLESKKLKLDVSKFPIDNKAKEGKIEGLFSLLSL